MKTLVTVSLFVLVSGAPSLALNPQPEPPGIRQIGRLSATELQTLPPGTQVSVGGRLTTLGALREVHERLISSRAAAKAPPILPGDPNVDTRYVDRTVTGNISFRSLPKAPQTAAGAAMPLVQDSSGHPYPNDYLAACTGATVCTYYPAITAESGGGTARWRQIDDPLVTSPEQCAQTGGTMIANDDGSGMPMCAYYYPIQQTVSFVPGPKGFTVSERGSRCNADAKIVIDPHGVVVLTDDFGYSNAADSQVSTCAVSVTNLS